MTALISSLKLALFPIIALVLFGLAFTVVLLQVYRRGARTAADRHAAIPLADEPVEPRLPRIPAHTPAPKA